MPDKNVRHFVTEFTGAKVALDWPRAIQERWRVSPDRTISSLQELCILRIAWYLLPTDQEADCCTAAVHQIRVGEAADKFGSAKWYPHRIVAITKYANAFRAADVLPLRITLPAYVLPNDELLLLDGSHRAVALAISQVQFVLTLLCMYGPLDERALVDLKHSLLPGVGET